MDVEEIRQRKEELISELGDAEGAEREQIVEELREPFDEYIEKLS